MTQTERLIPVPYIIESSQTTTVRIQLTIPEIDLVYGELMNDAAPAVFQRPSGAWRAAHARILDEYERAWEILAQ